MSNLLKKVTFQDVKNAEKRIAKAEKKVCKTMNVFTKAANDVELANTELTKAIADSDSKINSYMESIAKAKQTKDKAQSAVEQNKALLSKLTEFIPTRNE